MILSDLEYQMTTQANRLAEAATRAEAEAREARQRAKKALEDLAYVIGEGEHRSLSGELVRLSVADHPPKHIDPKPYWRKAYRVVSLRILGREGGQQ